MASQRYEITYKKSVEKELRKLPKSQIKIIVTEILALTEEPRPVGSTKLRGTTSLYRIRHAEFRIIYDVQDDKLVILVVKVGHRRDVYRNF